MREWRNLKVGDRVSFHYNEFDGSGVLHGRVSEVSDTRAIVRIWGSDYWLDDDNKQMFSKGWN